MNKTVTKKLLQIFLLLCLITTTIHPAESSIQDPFQKPTHYSVCFADDIPKVYPANIINRLVIVQEASKLGFKTSRVVDLSHTPGLTKNIFNTLVGMIVNPRSRPKSNTSLLLFLETAHTLFPEDEPVCKKLFYVCINRLRKCSSTTFFHNTNITNTQAALLIQLIKKEAHSKPHYTFLEKIKCLTRDFVCTNIATWPVPNYTTGNPDTTDFPISLDDLIQAGEIDITTTDLNLPGRHITSLKGIKFFSRVTQCDLSHNNIKRIGKETFKDLPLVSLNLNNNQIEEIKSAQDLSTNTPNWFPYLPNCKISLQNNPITRATGWFDRRVLRGDYDLVMNRE